MKVRIVLILGLLFFLSCSSTNKMTKTENPRLVKKLLENNGNVFCASSTHVIISYVWSYSADEISIYKLKKGKIVNTEVHSIEDKNWLVQPTKEDYFELDKCMELDGDMLCIVIKDEESKDLPINLQCFMKGGYKTEFFNQLALDMEKYKIKIQN